MRFKKNRKTKLMLEEHSDKSFMSIWLERIRIFYKIDCRDIEEEN